MSEANLKNTVKEKYGQTALNVMRGSQASCAAAGAVPTRA